MSRRKIREYIFKLLYRVEFFDRGDLPEQEELFLDMAKFDDPAFRDDGYICGKFEKIIEKLPEIDEKLSARMKEWSMERIGRTELAIMRLAVYEALYDEDVPTGVAINEAVELSKKYCEEDAYGFVNAVLGEVTRTEKQSEEPKF